MKYISFIILSALLFTLISLGTWQVYRWHYKQEIILKLQQPASTSPDIITKNLNYIKVKLNILINKQTVLYVYAGKKGYHALIPVQMPDNKTALVNIGVVAQKSRIMINGYYDIEGIILFKIKKPLLISNYDNKSDIWLSADTKAMGAKLGIDLEPYIIWAEHANIEGIENNGPVAIYNRHLEYIVTWYGLALILVAYLIYARTKNHC